MDVGVLRGVVAPEFAKQLGPLGSIFLRLIRSIVALLVFVILAAGIAASGGAKNIGCIGAKAIRLIRAPKLRFFDVLRQKLK